VAYIPFTAVRSVGPATQTAGVNFSIETENKFTVTSDLCSFVLVKISGGTTVGNYVKVEEGESVTFKLRAGFDSSLTGYYRLQLLNVGYSGTESPPTKVQTASPQETFQTDIVEVKASAGTQSRNTASIWEAIKSFFK
jgi:hypothetical protein